MRVVLGYVARDAGIDFVGTSAAKPLMWACLHRRGQSHIMIIIIDTYTGSGDSVTEKATESGVESRSDE